MALNRRKSVFSVSDKVKQKSVCSATETSWNSACSKWSDNTFQKENNKSADQIVLFHRLVCAFVVCM